jgi:EAL domain-containing protein (putative c-di-GMP-specific phosphodiesterase class I)
MGTNIETLMRAADIAMYCAKASGGGQYCLFSSELAEKHQSRSTPRLHFAKPCCAGEFVLAMQPQLSLVSGEITGRRRCCAGTSARRPSPARQLHPGRGIERDHRRDWRVGISEVASMMADWQHSGVARRLAFNVSPRQLERGDFFAILRAAFVERQVPFP